MPQLLLSISPDVLTKFASVQTNVLMCKGVPSPDLGDKDLLQNGVNTAAAALQPLPNIADHPAIARWRTIYGAMGVKPSKFRSSIEALARRAVKGDNLSLDVPLVNAYNAISLKWLTPLGACDVAKLPSERIDLRLSDPTRDRFEPLGGDASSFPLSSELVVYAAQNDVLCWGFNCRDSRKTALSANTTEALFFAEAALPEQAAAARGALEELGVLLVAAGFACPPILQLSAESPFGEISY